MEKTKLEMDFVDVANKVVRIAIEEPREDLNNTEIEDAMNNIVALNIFESKEGNLTGISGARIIRTNVTDIKF